MLRIQSENFRYIELVIIFTSGFLICQLALLWLLKVLVIILITLYVLYMNSQEGRVAGHLQLEPSKGVWMLNSILHSEPRMLFLESYVELGPFCLVKLRDEVAEKPHGPSWLLINRYTQSKQYRNMRLACRHQNTPEF